MAKDIQAIFSQAALVRDESGESENTAQRVGGTLADLTDYVGNMERDVSDNINSAVNNAKNELNTRINDCVTTQRFKGEADDSRADTDPFIVLGRFSRSEGESTEAYHGRINAAIDGTFSQSAGSANGKYCGDMRVFTSGVRTNIHQYVINYDAGKYVQVADGPIDVDTNGKLLFTRDNYKVFSRLIEGGVAGSWTEFGGRDSSVLDIGTFANKDAACAYAARAEIAGNKQAALIIFHATGATGALLEGRIFQQVNGISESMQYLMWDKKLYRRNVTGASGVEGDNTSAFAWEETGAQKLQYDSSARKLTMKSYENGVIAEVTLPLAGSSNAGLIGAGDSTKINNANTLSETNAYYGVNRFNGFTDGVTLQINTSLKRLPVMYDRTLKTFVGKDINISGGTSTVKYYRSWLGSNIFNDTSTNKPHTDHTYLCAGKMYEWNGTDLVEIGIETQSNDNGTE